MTRAVLSPRTQRRVSLALFVALLPMLTFVGHWPASVGVPGTNLYISIPLGGTASHHEHSDGGSNGHEHAQHCHGNSAGCSDVPLADGAGFALMAEAVAVLGAGGIALLLALTWWSPRQAPVASPELRPPRPRLLAA